MEKIKKRIQDHGLLLYDGECGFCQFWVQFIIQRDKRAYFLFAPLQAAWTKPLQDPATNGDLNSIIFFDGIRVYQKSRAVLRVAGHMDGVWKLAPIFLIVPSFLADPLYDFVARRRKRLSRLSGFCKIPTPEERKRFLSDDPT